MITPAVSIPPTLLAQPANLAAPAMDPSGAAGAGGAFAERMSAATRPPLDLEQRISEIRTRNPGVLQLSSRSAELVELARELAHGRVDPSPLEMFQLQLELSEVQFGLEMATKVVEHATSGAKTALQTQM